MQLIIASKNYSSWSMRPWVLMTHFGVPFDEVVIGLAQADTDQSIRRYSPSGKLPCLIDGDLVVWDSLAISETIAERYPDHAFWPRDPAARAHARAISAEMHSSFAALRTAMPMNIRARVEDFRVGAEAAESVAADIARIDALWSDCLSRSGGPFLFGDFTIADAMYVAVVMRFNSYAPPLSEAAATYAARITALPAVQQWTKAAVQEPGIARYDALI